MPAPRRGEVWLVDLGYVAKARPAVVLSIPADDTDRALVTIVPHTTSLRGTRFEVVIPVNFLSRGPFDAQNLATTVAPKFQRRLGTLTPDQLGSIEEAVRAWLAL